MPGKMTHVAQHHHRLASGQHRPAAGQGHLPGDVPAMALPSRRPGAGVQRTPDRHRLDVADRELAAPPPGRHRPAAAASSPSTRSSVDIETGSITGLLGRNGVGKPVADRISRAASAGSRASSQLSTSPSCSSPGKFAASSMSSSAVSSASSGTRHTSARRLATHSPSGVTAGAFDAAGLALAIMPKSASSAVSPSILGIPCEESPDSAPCTSTSRSCWSQISSASSRTSRSSPRPAGGPSS